MSPSAETHEATPRFIPGGEPVPEESIGPLPGYHASGAYFFVPRGTPLFSGRSSGRPEAGGGGFTGHPVSVPAKLSTGSGASLGDPAPPKKMLRIHTVSFHSPAEAFLFGAPARFPPPPQEEFYFGTFMGVGTNTETGEPQPLSWVPEEDYATLWRCAIRMRLEEVSAKTGVRRDLRNLSTWEVSNVMKSRLPYLYMREARDILEFRPTATKPILVVTGVAFGMGANWLKLWEHSPVKVVIPSGLIKKTFVPFKDLGWLLSSRDSPAWTDMRYPLMKHGPTRPFPVGPQPNHGFGKTKVKVWGQALSSQPVTRVGLEPIESRPSIERLTPHANTTNFQAPVATADMGTACPAPDPPEQLHWPANWPARQPAGASVSALGSIQARADEKAAEETRLVSKTRKTVRWQISDPPPVAAPNPVMTRLGAPAEVEVPAAGALPSHMRTSYGVTDDFFSNRRKAPVRGPQWTHPDAVPQPKPPPRRKIPSANSKARRARRSGPTALSRWDRDLICRAYVISYWMLCFWKFSLGATGPPPASAPGSRPRICAILS